jgi:N-hydroxyarylamine O-acetyltransferase
MIERSLVERTLERLGFTTSPTPDLDGLRVVYGAWCARVPFDNVRKLVALRTGDPRPLPGGEAADFLGHWLEHGTGGTCWPSSNGLYALLEALGFPVRRVAASMRDTGVRSHGSVKARLDGRDWLVDSSMLTLEPLPLGDTLHLRSHPIVPVEIEPAAAGEDGTHVLWFDNPAQPDTWLPCRLLDDPVGLEFYLDRYERSRTDSPFNGIVVARVTRPEESRVLRGRKFSRRTRDGFAMTELGPVDVSRTLIEEIGISEAMVNAWRRCGGLDASFAPPPPAPPMETRLPPSRR